MTQDTSVHHSSLFANVLADYSAWFAQVIRALFYKEDLKDGEGVKFPPAFAELIGVEGKLGLGLSQIEDIQRDLHELASFVLEADHQPSRHDFDAFLQAYEGFIGRVQRLEVDSVLSDFGMDRSTGLRSATVMIADLERELERRSRRGQPFSIAIAQIDGLNSENRGGRIQKASEAIRVCMRSFDDAYVSGDGEFIISLKHSDTTGALRFVERLRRMLQEGAADFTMSYCVAEPLPGENIPDLIANVRQDLTGVIADGAGGVAQYEDISPLQRFIQRMDDTTKR